MHLEKERADNFVQEETFRVVGFTIHNAQLCNSIIVVVELLPWTCLCRNKCSLILFMEAVVKQLYMEVGRKLEVWVVCVKILYKKLCKFYMARLLAAGVFTFTKIRELPLLP